MRDKPADRQAVEKLLRRLLKTSAMRRLPKSRKDTNVFLALAATTFDTQATYTEVEVNDVLEQWLAGFADPVGLDHVTVRRELVDAFFLLRDPAGDVYRTNQTVISQYIAAEARAVQPDVIFSEAVFDRQRRKQRAMTGAGGKD